MPLNDNQRRFIALYRSTLPRNATRAYEAVYTQKGYAARVAASILITNRNVRTAIDEADAADLTALGLAAYDVLRGIAQAAFSDVRQLFTPEGTIKAPHTLDDDLAAAVNGVEITETSSLNSDGVLQTVRTHKIRLCDKTENRKLLAQYLKLLTATVQVDVQASLTAHETLLANALKRSEDLREERRHANGHSAAHP